MSDYLDMLPTNDEPMDPIESEILNAVIEPKGSFYYIVQDLRHVIIATFIFFIVNLEIMDNVLQSTISYAKSSKMSLVVVKTIVFGVLLFIATSQL